MWAEMYPGETEAALADRIRTPPPRAPKAISIWSAAGDLLTSPFEGAARGVNETLRVASRFATARASDGGQRAGLLPGLDAPASIQRQREISANANEQMAADADQLFRRGADYWRPDAATANWATNFLHEGGRILGKVAGYSALAGLPGAVAGTSLDEGATSYLGLRDRGVDPATAAKVGAVHAGMTGLSIALPVVGKTALQTAGLVLGGGPASFMAESALSRAILESAAYPDIAAEFDPFDTMGLALSLVPGAAIGVAVHAGRARRGGAHPEAVPAAEPVPALKPGELMPEAVEAAHVVYQRDVLDSGMLARADDLQARAAHSRGIDEARQALDDGRPAQLSELHLDEGMARQVAEEMGARMRAADAPRLIEERRAADSSQMGTDPLPPRIDTEALAAPRVPAEVRTAEPATVRPAIQRALEIARERPDMPVRLEDDGSAAQSATDVIRAEATRAGQEASESTRAVQAAIECFLKVGTE